MTPKKYKEIREQIGTQSEVADLLGLRRLALLRRENGKSRIIKEADIAITQLLSQSKEEAK